MRPPDQCSGGGGHDDPDALRASRLGARESARDARRAVTHALRMQSAQRAVHFRRPRALRALPGNERFIVVCASRRPPPFAPRRGQKLPRTTVELCAFEPAALRGEAERGRGGIDRDGEREGILVGENCR